MPRYRTIPDLVADLERVLREKYHAMPWQDGLFGDDALAYWWATGKSAEEILEETYQTCRRLLEQAS